MILITKPFIAKTIWIHPPRGEAKQMAYPEPIPALKGEEAKEFLRRWRRFKLSPEQKELYRGARANYRAAVPVDDEERPE